ncbi:MAG: hypothetical protein L0387_33105 [Acidobacteria bacterium]|nr:hypothetical protein [Acidobacteriota bacterium]MCI0723849.1 hypothetical protein [Acidobacteriota bacterium]
MSSKKFVDLDPERRDRLGPSRLHLHYEENDIAMAQDMVQICAEITRTGCREVLSIPGRITVDELQIDYNH